MQFLGCFIIFTVKIAMQGVFGMIWGCTGSSALAIGIGGVLGIEGRVVAIDLSPLVDDKMTQEMSQSGNFTEISANDSVGKVLGKDHTGHVCCLRLGGLHSVAFQSTTSFNGLGSSFSNFNSVESSRLKEENTCLRDKLTTSEENVKTLKNVMLAYIQMKEGYIPFELGAMFGHNTSNVVIFISYNEGSGQDGPTPRGGSSLDSLTTSSDDTEDHVNDARLD
ncbi:hypothetical protein JHK87_009919 [Glycine soja]|nr:hypothetical protein JHK87_009919 [Glycine soja]